MLLVNGVDIKIHETSWLMYLLEYGLTPLLCILLLSSLGKSFSLNDIEVEPISDIKARFSDVAGMEEIKGDLLSLSEVMKNEDYRKSGAKIPRGILLEGPPGNGKTLLARAFAGETGVNFIAINACDLGSMFVGAGSSKIKKLFETAKKNSPCVIFIDEIDAVGTRRSEHDDSASKEMNTMLTALLNQMDGFKSVDNVMVLAATNRADALDDALVRPGRFDRKFVISIPDQDAREELFKLYSKNIKMADDVDFKKLAIRTYGQSCSSIECIVNESVLNSIKEKSDVVRNKDFEDAILQMTIKGHVKKKNIQCPNDKKIVAYHEAGHAILTYFCTDQKVSNISIIPTTSGAGGFTLSWNESEDVLTPIETDKKQILVLYGGRAAETFLGGGNIENSSRGSSNDIKCATTLAAQYVNFKNGVDYSVFGKYGVEKIMKETENLLAEVWEDALNIINEKWKYVEAVANKLIEKESMEYDEFVSIIKSCDEPSV
jgi:cell division protease FtsH